MNIYKKIILNKKIKIFKNMIYIIFPNTTLHYEVYLSHAVCIRSHEHIVCIQFFVYQQQQ
jgi:hypothetical protein